MGVMDKFKGMWKQPEDEGDYKDDYFDNQEDYAASEEEATPTASVAQPPKPSKVVNINRGPTADFEVCVFSPETYGGEASTDIADKLVTMNIVLLNLENTNQDTSRRIIDFLSGVTYANAGKMMRIAANTYLITPKNINVSGKDLAEKLENSDIYIS